MAKKKVPGWPGYVVTQANGLELFIIEKRVRSRRYHCSTRAHSLQPALEQLARFEADPEQYMATGPQRQGAAEAGPLVITDTLIDEWKAHQLGAKGNSPKWARTQARQMLDWMLKLNGANLRTVRLHQFKAALNGLTSRPHRIEAIKSFCAWLRTEKGLLRMADDATLDLKVPQAQPEKRRRRKAAAWADVSALLTYLQAQADVLATKPLGEFERIHPAEDFRNRRDCLLTLTATGWHVSELERFVRGGEVVRQAGSEILAVLVVRHKKGELTRTPISHREHLEAVERLRARGSVPRWLGNTHKQLCLDAGLPVFHLGSMRHSVATWAVEAGASPESVSRFLGHRDKRTTEKFYIDVAAPTNVIPLKRVAQ